MSSNQDVIKIVPSLLERSVDRFAATYLVNPIPSWVKPNHVTVFGFSAGILAAGAFYLASFNKYWFLVAASLVLVHLLADSVDGALARQRNLTSKAGFFLDQFLDVLMFVAIPLSISMSTYAPLKLTALAAIMYPLHMMLALQWIHLKQQWLFPRFGPCEIHLAFIVLALLTFSWSGSVVAIAGYFLGWFDLASLISTPLSFLELLASAMKLFRELESGAKP